LKIVLFLGYSGSGKTRALATLTRELTKKRRKRVATIKKIHEDSFSFDTKGKDTWLHASAGASLVLAVAPKEIGLISRYDDTEKLSVKEILAFFSGAGVDYLFVEGLHKKFEKVRGMRRVVCARSKEEALELLGMHGQKRVSFVTGKFASKFEQNSIRGVPVLSLPLKKNEALRLIG
jgi:molybdopterin-guanine dinucleotide biosynthesis protein B